MKKILAITLIGIAAAATAVPATARPHQQRYSQYADRPVYQDHRNVSTTDRDGDGYDDRDTNFNGWIDRWEQRAVSQRYANNRRNRSNGSATDRNGDGYDDRDANHNGYIEPWEIGGRDRRW